MLIKFVIAVARNRDVNRRIEARGTRSGDIEYIQLKARIAIREKTRPFFRRLNRFSRYLAQNFPFSIGFLRGEQRKRFITRKSYKVASHKL